ncbi:MAG: hypothetical protein U9R48_04295 [Chloroflexota bacterium]|nr:hypothetical protein [Chloroflexota bacterium]
MPREAPQSEPLDLNILPEKYRPQAIPPIIVMLGVTAVVFLLLAVVSFVLLHRNRASMAELSHDLEVAQSTLQALRTPPPTVMALRQELSRTQQALEVIREVYPTMAAGRRDWGGIFEAILSYDGERMRLTELYQDGLYLTLAGVALSREDILTYARRLEHADVFEEVMVESLEGSDRPIEPATPTPSLTATATPATPTATPTAVRYDKYEVDDFIPSPIALGEVQWHNFNPVRDMDQMFFTAKGGRRYCVEAIPQVAGVDTLLQVSVGGVGYVNDDCVSRQGEYLTCECPVSTMTGSLASLVEFQIPEQEEDQRVVIKVTNNGQYGPSMWYVVRVYQAEVSDFYENDDASPRPIAVGETQHRAFYPTGDVDRVQFPVKADRTYRLQTANLAVGVDTVLSVFVGDQGYSSDDVSLDDLSSLVEFRPRTDGVASALITNKGEFGPHMTYDITLSQAGGDAYEPDDLVPSLISPGEQQRRTFFPENDIDRVEFNVKAGRIYELRTYSLTVGVDTVLTVLFGGVSYTDDDVGPGDRSSRVVFKAPADGQAGVTVRNRERFGPDMVYWLTLNELSATPTPTGTPEPGCEDIYEPDDVVPRLMAVGEEQNHTFCPQGDVDRAVFTAKAGYAYEVETDDLSLGVDTYISVQIGDVTLTNDDRAPQELSSRVQISNILDTDLPAFVTIRNKGLFGFDSSGNTRGYTLRVKNVNLSEGDDFEPDMEVKRYLSVNEVQRHTFSPDGDMDRLYLRVKAGRKYVVATCGSELSSSVSAVDTGIITGCEKLLPGVDSVLVVAGPVRNCYPQSCQSDDAWPGTGYLNSRVTFEAQTDGEVTVTIYNKGLFGPDREYYVFVWEVAAATPTSSPTLAPSVSPTPTLTPPPYPLSSRSSLPAARSEKGMVWDFSLLSPRSLPKLALQAADGDGNVEFVLVLKMRSVQQ